MPLATSGALSGVDTLSVQEGITTSPGAVTFNGNVSANTLTLAGSVAGSSSGATAGAKTLNIEGAGSTLLLGNVTPGGAFSL